MTKRASAATSKPAAAAALAAAPTPEKVELLQVAYHSGPPEIGYFGTEWKRGVPQPVTLIAWQAMQERSDFAGFDFQITPDQPAAKE